MKIIILAILGLITCSFISLLHIKYRKLKKQKAKYQNELNFIGKIVISQNKAFKEGHVDTAFELNKFLKDDVIPFHSTSIYFLHIKPTVFKDCPGLVKFVDNENFRNTALRITKEGKKID